MADIHKLEKGYNDPFKNKEFWRVYWHDACYVDDKDDIAEMDSNVRCSITQGFLLRETERYYALVTEFDGVHMELTDPFQLIPKEWVDKIEKYTLEKCQESDGKK